jgi:hypothetical protein
MDLKILASHYKASELLRDQHNIATFIIDLLDKLSFSYILYKMYITLYTVFPGSSSWSTVIL